MSFSLISEDDQTMNTSILSIITESIIQADLERIRGYTEQALDQGISAAEVLEKGLMPGMEHVGEEFKSGNKFVPDVLRSSKAMAISMELLKPILSESGVEMSGKVVIGTVKGDLHDIGKNLVGIMCEGAGFEIFDLGNDVSPEDFVEAVEKYQPDILGMSALLTTTMHNMKYTIQALEAAGLRHKLKVMVGGSPVTRDFAHQIGADGYAADAASAAELATSFITR